MGFQKGEMRIIFKLLNIRRSLEKETKHSSLRNLTVPYVQVLEESAVGAQGLHEKVVGNPMDHKFGQF
jgi:hypothetical protein